MSLRKSSLFLWQLFGWEPQSLFDQIFNVVESTGVQAQKLIVNYAIDTDKKLGGMYTNELERGQMLLKQMFVEIVDLVMDKFEVYVYRNSFAIPPDLISEGWMRTPDQEGVDFSDLDGARRVEYRLKNAHIQIDAKRQHLAERQLVLKELEAQHENLEAILASIPKFTEKDQLRLQELLKSVHELRIEPRQVHRSNREEFNELVQDTEHRWGDWRHPMNQQSSHLN